MSKCPSCKKELTSGDWCWDIRYWYDDVLCKSCRDFTRKVSDAIRTLDNGDTE